MNPRTRRQIENEIAAGKLGVARDRLHGSVLSNPDDMSQRSRLGDVYSALGYPVEAGRFWFLDKDLTDEKKAAIDQFVLSCGGKPDVILQRLKLRCSPEVVSSPVARARIEELIEECKARNLESPKFKRMEQTVRFQGRWWILGCTVSLLIIFVLAVVGASVVFKALLGGS